MNQKITFPELVNAISESTGYSKHLSEEFLKELFSLITNTLASGENVKIKKLGTFKVVEVDARKSVKVGTGEEIEIPGHKKVSFTPDKELAEAINLPFAAFETIELKDSVTDEMLESTDDQPLTDEISIEVKKEVAPPLPLTEWDAEDDADDIDETKDDIAPESSETPDEGDDITQSNLDNIADYNDIEEDDSIIASASENIDIETTSDDNETNATAESIDSVDSESAEERPSETVEISEQRIIETTISEASINQESTSEESESQAIAAERESSENSLQSDIDSNEETSTRRKGFLPGFIWGIVASLAVFAIAATAIYFVNPQLFNIDSEALTQSTQIASVDNLATDSTSAITDTAQGSTSEEKVIMPDTKPSDEVVYDTISLTRFLTTMAREHYGNYHLWPYIYEENSKILGHPDRIRPGTRVVIPSMEKYNINPDDPECIKQAKRKGVEIYNRYKK
ncbi:MAG: HU family DNA-binding protein [Muribaculaceae bacterium]|nr:HU family DNA-binding protein [Muribaculaceae bacterium]